MNHPLGNTAPNNTNPYAIASNYSNNYSTTKTHQDHNHHNFYLNDDNDNDESADNNLQGQLEDLEFMTTIDTSVTQSVPIPSKPPTLSNTTNNNDNTYNTIHNNPSNNNNNNNNNNSVTRFISSIFEHSSHPIPCLFHLLFKALSLTLYIIGGFFGTSNSGTNFIIVTVICILLQAADFWTTKNITGRLLVGLRWWCYVEGEDGSINRWIFESSERFKANAFDKSVFWTVLYMTPIIWGVLFLFALVKFHFGWCITVVFGIVLSGANTYGYYKCSKDQKDKFEKMMVNSTMLTLGSGMANSVGSVASGLLGKIGQVGSSIAGLAAGNRYEGVSSSQV